MEGQQIAATPPGTGILVVEDSPTQAAHLQYILEKNSYHVSTAGNGREALSILAGHRPAVVISDIVMPEMDGYELCRTIKADPRYRDIPVILLTSLADPLDVIRGLECGADHFITKPYSEEYLLSRITNIQLAEEQPVPAETPTKTEIFFECRKFSISSNQRQSLNLLLSTYEAAMQKNRELSKARDELNELNIRLEAANRKLAAANRELEAFNYTVSHDLRSPLTGISGYCQILTEICGDRLDADCAGYVQGIAGAARRMDELITTILSFSRIARSELRRETVNLSDIAKAVAAQLRMSAPHRQVMFTIAEGAMVSGDMRLLRVVMDNLLGNAWKYTEKREPASIEFGVSESHGGRVCYVRDNGIGFDMSEADKLFAPFQRLTTTEEFEGHGIGLATVQRIIERHGGHVWAESEPGKGAVFYFTLPDVTTDRT